MALCYLPTYLAQTKLMICIKSTFIVWNNGIVSHIQVMIKENDLIGSCQKSAVFSGFSCVPFFRGVPLPLPHDSREGHKQNLFAICKKKWKGGIKRKGLQKTVKLYSMSPLMHAVFNLLCASWRLGECVRG